MLTTQHLAAVSWECVHFVDRATGEGVLRGLSATTSVLRVNGSVLDSKQTLMRAMGDAFRLPSYFAGNWDSLDECLRDLEWLPASAYVFVMGDASTAWRRAAPELGTLVETWLGAASSWANKGVPFHLLFVW